MVEIGCGPFTLEEDPELLALVRDRFIYHGIDGSPEAVHLATKLHPELRFSCLDLTYRPPLLAPTSTAAPRPAPGWLEAVKPTDGQPWIILSRRTLQNLTPRERVEVLPEVLSASHGVLVESTQGGLKRLNALRAALKKDPLPLPEFNDYLGEVEERQIKRVGSAYNFMGPYYALTRAVLELDGFGTDLHDLSMALALACQMNESAVSAWCSPLKGFAW